MRRDGILDAVSLRWKSPEAVGRQDDPFLEFAPHLDATGRSGRRWRVVVALLLVPLAVASAWALTAEGTMPETVSWCERSWKRSRSEPVDALPRRLDSLAWTSVRAGGVSFTLPLSGASCPRNMPTVGYVEHSNQFYGYALQGGP